MKLSAVSDTISDEPKEQFSLLREKGFFRVDFRTAWGKSATDLSEWELREVKKELERHHLKVVSIMTSVGRLSVTAPFEPQLDLLNRSIDVAHYLGAKYVRIFSFCLPDREGKESYRKEIFNRMRSFLQLAMKRKIILLVENEKGGCPEAGKQVAELLLTLQSPYLRAAFNPAHFVLSWTAPYSHVFPYLAPFLASVRANDAVLSTGEITAYGEGDGEALELLMALRDHGYNGVLSVEPSLEEGGVFSGERGFDSFSRSAHYLQRMAKQLEMTWE